jgi:hypothetical protein
LGYEDNEIIINKQVVSSKSILKEYHWSYIQLYTDEEFSCCFKKLRNTPYTVHNYNLKTSRIAILNGLI